MSGLGTMYKPARQIKHQCWERSCKAAASGSVKREMAGRPEVGAQISLAPRSVCQRFLPICNRWTNFPVTTRLLVPFKESWYCKRFLRTGSRPSAGRGAPVRCSMRHVGLAMWTRVSGSALLEFKHVILRVYFKIDEIITHITVNEYRPIRLWKSG